MIIYKDVISGDEMFSDTYKMKLIDDFAYELEGKMVTETTTVDDSTFGGNASAEGVEDEGADNSTSQSGCNIVLANRLVEVNFDKKGYQVYIKDYMKAIKKRLEETNPDRVSAFEEGAKKFMKERVLPNFKNWQFFQGEKMDPEGLCALMDFREDGVTPYMLFFKDGLEEEKV